MVLRTYRHNSPPMVCNPGETTLLKCTRLCKPTFLKAKKLLTLKGLIKYQPGGGRKITNKYTFPLEDGTDEEKRRLLAYLNAKKTGKKSNQLNGQPPGGFHFTIGEETGKKSNQLNGQKQVKNRTRLQPNCEQKTGKKSNQEQEVSQKKQQQKPAATSSFISSIKKVQETFQKLKAIGVTKRKAQNLIRQHPLSTIQTQLNWLPYRNITYPAGALIASLKEHWPQPLNFSRQGRPENDSQEYKKQYECLKKASKQRGRLDMERRRKGKIGKKLNPYAKWTGPPPYFADQVPDEICKDCPLAHYTHALEHKTHGRLICLRRDVKAGLVGVLFSATKKETGKKSNQLEENGIPKRKTQPAIP